MMTEKRKELVTRQINKLEYEIKEIQDLIDVLDHEGLSSAFDSFVSPVQDIIYEKKRLVEAIKRYNTME